MCTNHQPLRMGILCSSTPQGGGRGTYEPFSRKNLERTAITRGLEGASWGQRVSSRVNKSTIKTPNNQNWFVRSISGSVAQAEPGGYL